VTKNVSGQAKGVAKKVSKPLPKPANKVVTEEEEEEEEVSFTQYDNVCVGAKNENLKKTVMKGPKF
jgi:menaquinone-dependent protoporphyrinogen IX oxidase